MEKVLIRSTVAEPIARAFDIEPDLAKIDLVVVKVVHKSLDLACRVAALGAREHVHIHTRNAVEKIKKIMKKLETHVHFVSNSPSSTGIGHSGHNVGINTSQALIALCVWNLEN